MKRAESPIRGVPTNVITGFLGAGKTSAILNLLKCKPADERWAVLVNEFGEIGVDGSLVQGQCGEHSGVFTREVPGGCMCCTAGMPMQIALAQLLRRARPHRLFIEPTGLGHPLEVLKTLCSVHNREVLSIQKTLTLVDPRKLSDERYSTHETFRQQLSIADVVVANKNDLCSAEDRRKLVAYIGDVCRPGIQLIYTQYGKLCLDHLSGPAATMAETQAAHPDRQSQPLLAGDLPFPEVGYVTAINQGEGFESIGWRFSPQKVFDRDRLSGFLSGLDVERMKAVFITLDGTFAYNMTRDTLTEVELDERAESRVEIIADRIDPNWVNNLTRCLAATA